ESNLQNIQIEFREIAGNELPIVHLNGENVEEEIRKLPVANNVSFYSKNKKLREKLVSIQRKIGEFGGIVMDGRDIGSKVFPNAELKIFLTSSPKIRATRRYEELTAKGEKVDFNTILQNVLQRDKEDSTRKESPLIQVSDAVLIDNSNMTKTE